MKRKLPGSASSILKAGVLRLASSCQRISSSACSKPKESPLMRAVVVTWDTIAGRPKKCYRQRAKTMKPSRVFSQIELFELSRGIAHEQRTRRAARALRNQPAALLRLASHGDDRL